MVRPGTVPGLRRIPPLDPTYGSLSPAKLCVVNGPRVRRLPGFKCHFLTPLRYAMVVRLPNCLCGFLFWAAATRIDAAAVQRLARCLIRCPYMLIAVSLIFLFVHTVMSVQLLSAI